jgi:hypothetical protein
MKKRGKLIKKEAIIKLGKKEGNVNKNLRILRILLIVFGILFLFATIYILIAFLFINLTLAVIAFSGKDMFLKKYLWIFAFIIVLSISYILLGLLIKVQKKFVWNSLLIFSIIGVINGIFFVISLIFKYNESIEYPSPYPWAILLSVIFLLFNIFILYFIFKKDVREYYKI